MKQFRFCHRACPRIISCGKVLARCKFPADKEETTFMINRQYLGTTCALGKLGYKVDLRTIIQAEPQRVDLTESIPLKPSAPVSKPNLTKTIQFIKSKIKRLAYHFSIQMSHALPGTSNLHPTIQFINFNHLSKANEKSQQIQRLSEHLNWLSEDQGMDVRHI